MSERLKHYCPLLLSLPLILTAIWRIGEYLPIYYDGSYFVFTNLFKLKFANDGDISRMLGHYLYESLPLAYARWSSNPGLKTTAYLYSTSSILVPLFFVLSCWWILPRNKKDFFYYPLIGYSVMTITSLTFDCNELNLGHALMWVMCCLLLRDKKSKLLGVGIILVTVGMAFSYPVFILLVPALMLMIWRFKEWPGKVAFAIIALVFLLTFALSAHHNSLMPGTSQSFIKGFREIFMLFTATSAVSICAFFMVSLFLKGKLRTILFSSGVIFTLIYFLWKQHEFENWYLYSGRVSGLFMAALMASLMLIFRKKPSIIHAAFFIGFSIYTTSFYIHDWHKVQEDFFHASRQFSGFVKFEDFVKRTTKFQHNCTHWNAEMFSVMIQVINDKPVNVVVRRHPDFPESFLTEYGPMEFNRRLEMRGAKVSFKGPVSLDD